MKARIVFAVAFAALAVAVSSAPASASAAPERLLAPASVCPDQTDPTASPAAQGRAMRCLINFARRGRGLGTLDGAAVLDRAAGRKSADILRCDSFSHEACDRPFTYWMQRFGYDGCAEGENIAWGSGRLGSVRAIFRAWMHSAGHRENILGPYEQIGIGLRVGTLEGTTGAHVWTQDFATPC
jgi:uncharacterized protein YkwD